MLGTLYGKFEKSDSHGSREENVYNHQQIFCNNASAKKAIGATHMKSLFLCTVQ